MEDLQHILSRHVERQSLAILHSSETNSMNSLKTRDKT